MLRGLSWPESIQLPIWMSGLEPYEIAEFFEKPLDAGLFTGMRGRLLPPIRIWTVLSRR